MQFQIEAISHTVLIFSQRDSLFSNQRNAEHLNYSTTWFEKFLTSKLHF